MARAGARVSQARKNARPAPEPTREIIKVKLEPRVHEQVGAYLQKNGLFSQWVNSRLYEWFAEQPNHVQASILGLLPADFAFDEIEAILQQIADRKSGR